MSRTSRQLPFAAAAGFDDPLEVLLGCHRRIEKQLGALRRLAADVAKHGVSAEASTSALALLAYFDRAAVQHHEDEEHDLFPLLESRITDPGEHARFEAFRDTWRSDHRVLESAWGRLRRSLEAVSDGRLRPIAAVDVDEFAGAYARHILSEEHALGDFFTRWLDDYDRGALGRAMAARRVR